MWDRLLTVLTLMYSTCEQSLGADDASNYRLIVARWVERKAFGAQKRGRCTPPCSVHVVVVLATCRPQPIDAHAKYREFKVVMRRHCGLCAGMHVAACAGAGSQSTSSCAL